MIEDKETRLKLISKHIEAINQKIRMDKGDILELATEKQKLLKEYEQIKNDKDGNN